MEYAWTCRCCGKQYSSLPLDYAFDAPQYWDELSAVEQAGRGTLDSDFCTIRHDHQTDHFVRGCLEIPIIGRADHLVFGVWVSLSEDSLRRALELWDTDPDRDEPARFGWLSNRLPLHPDTLNLKAMVHFRGRKLRPAVELQPTDHPLAVEQREGVTLARVEEIAAALGRHQ